MGFANWMSGWLCSASRVRSGRRQRAKKRGRLRFRLTLEQLEPRFMPSAAVATDKLDYAPGQTAPDFGQRLCAGRDGAAAGG